MSPDSPRAFVLFLDQLQVILSKKLRLKKSRNYTPPPFQIPRYAIGGIVT